MSETDCTVCPELRVRLAATAAGVRGLAAFIDRELEEPTMPWKDLLPLVAMHAQNLAEQAEGRY